MRKILIKIFSWFLIILVCLFIFLYTISFKQTPEKIQYGLSFNKIYADELGLPWKDVYLAILDDLNVKNLRLSAHWNMVEPIEGKFDFSVMDYQIKEAEKRGVKVIFGVGRRLPRWPECHEPAWAKDLSWEDKKEKITEYIRAIVNRYKDSSAIEIWQVENEPFLTVFADEHCGDDLDVDFLKEEIDLVKKLDQSRQVLVTDSGNLGLWYPAWRAGDIFGTSIYMYLWNPDLGQIKTVYSPAMFRAKENLIALVFGKKEAILIELSLEPWLLKSVPDVPIKDQLERMSIDKFEEIIEFAKKTRFEKQYLWGAEWWYWMKDRGYSEFWEKGIEIFN